MATHPVMTRHVLAEPAFDLLTLEDEVTAHRLHDHGGRQTRLCLFRDRHDDLQRLFPWDLLCRIQKVLDGVFVEIALAERRRVTTIEELRECLTLMSMHDRPSSTRYRARAVIRDHRDVSPRPAGRSCG